MPTVKIFSKNATYQKFEVLKSNRNKRYKYAEFLVEGVRNINGALQNGWDIRSFLYAGGVPLSSWAEGLLNRVKTLVNYELTSALMAQLSGKEDTSELMAVVAMREDKPERLVLSGNPVLALFDRPSNRGNLGTILRSCDALGVEALIITGHAVDLYDPEVVVSSMGSFFRVPALRLTDNGAVVDFIAELKRRFDGFQVIGTTAHRQHPLYGVDLTKPTLFMIGNETDGLCRAFKDSCDLLATIPMAETAYASSFNVGCAAIVMFYEAARQRAPR